MGPCQYNFNSGVHAIGKTTVALKKIKTGVCIMAGFGLETHAIGQFWDLASTTGLACTRLGRRRLLSRKSNRRLHNGWFRTRNTCDWPRNVKSSIRKAKPRKHNTKMDCIQKTCREPLPTKLQVHFFALHSLYLRPF